VDPAIATEALGALAESAAALRAGLEAVPTGGRRRQRDKSQRLRAYLRFQEAAIAASVWPGWFSVVEQAVLSKRVTMADVWRDLSAARDSVPTLLGALSEIRLVGNPELRQLAEEIVTLLVELMEVRLPGRPPDGVMMAAAGNLYKKSGAAGLKAIEERFPKLAGKTAEARALLDPDLRKAQEVRFNECLQAIALWHKKFTLAARKDLGYGSRWWHVASAPRMHRWQAWRPYEPWPGGWPPPEAADLIRQAHLERSGKALAKTPEEAPGRPGPDVDQFDVLPNKET